MLGKFVVVAFALCLLAQTATARNTLAGFRRDLSLLEAVSYRAKTSMAFSESTICLLNFFPDDAENLANIVVIKAIAGSKTVHELKPPTEAPKKSEFAAAVGAHTERAVAFVTEKACGEVVVATHGGAGMFTLARYKRALVNTAYQPFFDAIIAVASVKRVHFASCLCNLKAHAKLGLCVNGIINPMIKGSTNGWLQLPAIPTDKWDITFYRANYEAISQTSGKNSAKFSIDDVKDKLIAIRDKKYGGVKIGHVTVDAGKPVFTEWTGAQQKSSASSATVASSAPVSPAPTTPLPECTTGATESDSRNCRTCDLGGCTIM